MEDVHGLGLVLFWVIGLQERYDGERCRDLAVRK
jgi:hypothetical protein